MGQAQLAARRTRKRANPLFRARAEGGGHNGVAEPAQQDLEQLAQQLIAADPEAMRRIERVTAAAKRVEELQAEQARLAAAMADEASVGAQAELEERQQVLAASSTVADAEVRAAELLLQAAALEAEQAEAAKQRWVSESDRVGAARTLPVRLFCPSGKSLSLKTHSMLLLAAHRTLIESSRARQRRQQGWAAHSARCPTYWPQPPALRQACWTWVLPPHPVCCLV